SLGLLVSSALEVLVDLTPVEQKENSLEGTSVTLSYTLSKTMHLCYGTSYKVYLYWYRHRSNQAPQFILYKGAGTYSSQQNIPDRRYQSTTSRTSTELTITQLTLADTALYYCALWRHSDRKCGGAFI
uniref:Ig-like domain-containing protein n=1 Tax=Gadus morhua TaxID=8049 RepID=A0A8C5AI95_GADMO